MITGCASDRPVSFVRIFCAMLNSDRQGVALAGNHEGTGIKMFPIIGNILIRLPKAKDDRPRQILKIKRKINV